MNTTMKGQIMTFDDYMVEVDNLMYARAGVTSRDIAVYPYSDCYYDEADPALAARAALHAAATAAGAYWSCDVKGGCVSCRRLAMDANDDIQMSLWNALRNSPARVS